MPDALTIRQRVAEMLRAPRTLSSIAHELGLTRPELEGHVRHLIRSAHAARHRVTIEPARCRACGFVFDERKLTKPGKCPECRESRIYEPLIRIQGA